jgi:hypothetical protein
VIPGAGRIGRRITFMVDEGATEVTSSYMIGPNFPAGETAQIDLGGIGRPVVGNLQPPLGFTEKVRWNFAIFTVVSDAAEARARSPYFTVTVDRDGKFRIDDVPAGSYSLNVRFQRAGAGHLECHRFDVFHAKDDLLEPPVDLGILTLEKR